MERGSRVQTPAETLADLDRLVSAHPAAGYPENDLEIIIVSKELKRRKIYQFADQ